MLRVWVVGAGIILERHMKAISRMERLQAVAVADVRLERAEEAARLYGVRAYTDYRFMVDKERADIVIVAVPHVLHREAAIYCAQAGSHILMEKPMALTVRECEEMIAAAKACQVQLMVGLTQHYFRENRMAREIVQRGDLGRLVMINDTRHQHYYSASRPEWFFHKTQAGGGILMNLGAHSIDKIQWLQDSRIRKVKAHLTHYGERGDVEGSGALWLESESGIPCTVVQSGYEGVHENATHLVFSHGMLRLETGKGLWISDQGKYRELPLPEAQDPFVLQLQDLVDAIDGVRPLECSGEYAKTINEVLEAVYRSYETNKEIEIGALG